MNQKTLEDFLLDGKIIISPRQEHTLTAIFEFYKKQDKVPPVTSHRGAEHILALLHTTLIELVDEEEGKRLAKITDSICPHGINMINISDIDKLLMQSSLVEIYRNHTFICVECQQSMIPNTEQMPGIYKRYAMGKTLADALQNAVSTRPTLERSEKKIIQP